MFYCYMPMFVAKLCSNQLIWGGPALKIASRERAGIPFFFRQNHVMDWSSKIRCEILQVGELEDEFPTWNCNFTALVGYSQGISGWG